MVKRFYIQLESAAFDATSSPLVRTNLVRPALKIHAAWALGDLGGNQMGLFSGKKSCLDSFPLGKNTSSLNLM